MEGNRKFVVDAGHARGENISIEEIQQALRDIMTWLESSIPLYSAPSGLSNIPSFVNPVLSVMLSLHNGGIRLQETFITLSLDSIQAAIVSCESSPH